MFGRLTSLRSGRPGRRAELGPVAPDRPVTAIADIHGCDDLLARALARAQDQDISQIICVGDYVDRGPDSAGVLRRLAGRDDVICLMGNHEEMMLDFLQVPERAGPRWLRAGGRATLASFGIDLPDEVPAAALEEIRDRLRAAMGAPLEAWLSALPSLWHSGNLLVSHAGADPRRAVQAQRPRDLRWGHADLGKIPRRDGLWVLRGHVVYEDPFIEAGVISIDTGAYATGRLTLAHIAEGGIRFAQV